MNYGRANMDMDNMDKMGKNGVFINITNSFINITNSLSIITNLFSNITYLWN